MIKRAGDVLGALERALTVIAVAFMFVIMMLVVTDVFMRYALNSPFSFTYDLIGLYLLAGVFFFTVSDALREHVHVGVDILLSRFSPAGRRLSEIVTALVGLFVFVLICKVGLERAIENYEQQDVLAGAIPWPTWVSAALVPLGCGVLVLRLALQLVGNMLSLVTGRDLYPLPPVTGIGEARSFE
ncbi:TRAP transporter small permease [Bradyrhizobium diazoefficiens]|uniref:TRAP transporter small permease n=1 Tax=Bradyrhizobium diazoefficiens TaxID=1355477 RepID=UPI00190BEF31|nr:TRAP transporter small permease [Bradyrhizobium diazoefficiens]MBK3660085.1 TRAP transporter small permease [Bradyrhizobium diazoefficiens]